MCSLFGNILARPWHGGQILPFSAWNQQIRTSTKKANFRTICGKQSVLNTRSKQRVLNQGLKPQLRFATWACDYCLAIWWETCGLEIRFARGGNGVSNCIRFAPGYPFLRLFSLHNPHYRQLIGAREGILIFLYLTRNTLKTFL